MKLIEYMPIKIPFLGTHFFPFIPLNEKYWYIDIIIRVTGFIIIVWIISGVL